MKIFNVIELRLAAYDVMGRLKERMHTFYPPSEEAAICTRGTFDLYLRHPVRFCKSNGQIHLATGN
jgi:hypothetical protein